MSPRLRFVIIGAAKSASTWLHFALRQHPAVYMPGIETHFFEEQYYDPQNPRALLAHLQPAPDGAMVGIKCPNYLCDPGCPERIASYTPDARLVAVLRNPVERAISQYYHLIRSGRLPLVPPDTAFSKYLAGRFDPPYTEQRVLRFGLYGEGIANYLRRFRRDQMLIITDLELRGNLVDTFRRVCRFLDIDPFFVPSDISMPRNQGAYTVAFLALIRRMNRLGLSFDARTGVETLQSGPVASAARRLAVLASRASAATRFFVRDQQPTVSRDIRAGLLDYYLPDIARLESTLGIDLSPWKVLRATSAREVTPLPATGCEAASTGANSVRE